MCTSSKNCTSGATLPSSSPSCSSGRYASICLRAFSKAGTTCFSPRTCSNTMKTSSIASRTLRPYVPGYRMNVWMRLSESRSACRSCSAVSSERSSCSRSNRPGVRRGVAVAADGDESAQEGGALVEEGSPSETVPFASTDRREEASPPHAAAVESKSGATTTGAGAGASAGAGSSTTEERSPATPSFGLLVAGTPLSWVPS